MVLIMFEKAISVLFRSKITQTCLWIFYFDIDIPEISLTVPSLKFGDDVELKATVDVDSLFIWLKKNEPENRFEILEQTKMSKVGKKRKHSYHIKNFSKNNEGYYQLIVTTKHTVARRTFQLQAGKRNNQFKLPLKH